MAQFLKKSAVMLRRSVVQKARVPVSVLRPNGYLEGELKEMFEEWMIQHKKSYHSLEEKDKRFQGYKNAVRESENYSPYYTPRINSFADMNMAEIAALNNESDDDDDANRVPIVGLGLFDARFPSGVKGNGLIWVRSSDNKMSLCPVEVRHVSVEAVRRTSEGRTHLVDI